MRWPSIHLDARYQAVGADNYRMAPTRFVVAVALTALAAVRVGWKPAALWAGVLLAFETWSVLVSRPMAKGPVGPALKWSYFIDASILVWIWSAYGLILWTGPTLGSALAAIVF